MTKKNKKQIVKISKDLFDLSLTGDLSVPATSPYHWCALHKHIYSKKVTFKVKKGKRYQLVNGMLKLVGHESYRDSSGMDYYKFIPNNPERSK